MLIVISCDVPETIDAQEVKPRSEPTNKTDDFFFIICPILYDDFEVVFTVLDTIPVLIAQGPYICSPVGSNSKCHKVLK